MQEKLPDESKSRVIKLESKILENSQNGNLKKAKILLDELRPILEKYGQNARLLQSYLYLYEGALEARNFDLAKRGFQFIRQVANKKTRVYLEATGLLAITYLRDDDLFSAEPLMKEVLNNEELIRSPRQRKAFITDLVDRFDSEGAITALSRTYNEPFAIEEIHDRAMDLLREGLSESEIEERLGRSVPDAVRNFILNVNRASRKALPPSDRLLLPPPREITKDSKIGSLIFRGMRNKLYKYVCDKESDLYQAWVHNGLDAICSQSYVAGAVVAVLTDLKIGAGAIAVGLTSLIVSKGISNFCAASKPPTFFSVRRKEK